MRNSYCSLEDSLRELTFLFAMERATLRRVCGWLPRIPYWDAKLAAGAHIWEDAGHAEALLKRLHELKETGAERRFAPTVEEILDNAAAAPGGDEFLAGLYSCIKPWLLQRYETHLNRIDPVMDAPTATLLRRVADEKRRQIEWFAAYRPKYSPPLDSARKARWVQELGKTISNCAASMASVLKLPPSGRGPAEPIALVAERDGCFRKGARGDTLAETADFEQFRLGIFWNHAQEMQFAESLAQILYETPEMPWAFHFDLSRHLADEVRHTHMGCARLEELNARLENYPMLVDNYAMRASLDPVARFCLMTLVMEAGSFESKRRNVERFVQHGDTESARCESYDIRDEMMHVHFGHVWVPVMLKVYHDDRTLPELIQQCRDVAVAGAPVATRGYS